MKMTPRDPLSKDRVPFYQILDHYEWVSDYLKLELLRGPIADLNQQIREINGAETSKDQTLENAKAAYNGYRKERHDWLVSHFFSGAKNAPNPLTYLNHDSYKVYRLPVFFELSEIEDAIKALPGGGITDEERKEQLQKLEAEKQKIEKKILKLCPSNFFKMNAAGIQCDIRDFFVNAWRDVQYRNNAAVGPQGVSLLSSAEPEKEAWGALGLRTSINRLGGEPFQR